MSGKAKIKTKASKEAMRWADDEQADGPTFREPSDEGNTFDVRMSEEADGVLAAKKIVACLKERGVCIVQANAPAQLLDSAFYEASELWKDGSFAPPFRVHDDRSMLEAQLWNQALKDEEKVLWIRDGKQELRGMNALKLLAKNMSDFAGGLGQLLQEELNIEFDRIGHAMLSCYSGDRRYCLHCDNAHGEAEDSGDEESLPDNGMRLTCVYFINPHWDPDEGCDGGLDVFLTDPHSTPSSSSSAKRAPKLRVAPHSDSLAIFLSERLAHQVIATRGKERQWFALTVWGLCGSAMQEMTKKVLARRQRASKEDSDDD